jgi:hypothetical protein
LVCGQRQPVERGRDVSCRAIHRSISRISEHPGDRSPS